MKRIEEKNMEINKFRKWKLERKKRLAVEQTEEQQSRRHNTLTKYFGETQKTQTKEIYCYAI